MEVAFRGRHVTRQPSPVTLLLVAKGGRSVAGTTLAFSLHATVTGAKPMVSHVQCEARPHVGINMHEISNRGGGGGGGKHPDLFLLVVCK